MLQSAIVRAQRLVGHGEIAVRGSLRGPIVDLQRTFRSCILVSTPGFCDVAVEGGGTHLQGYLQLLSVIPDGLVVDAERVVRVAHVPVRPPLGCVIAQFLREGQVGFVELQRCFVLPLHLVYDA